VIASLRYHFVVVVHALRRHAAQFDESLIFACVVSQSAILAQANVNGLTNAADDWRSRRVLRMLPIEGEWL
jgi:hypothetical protein